MVGEDQRGDWLGIQEVIGLMMERLRWTNLVTFIYGRPATHGPLVRTAASVDGSVQIVASAFGPVRLSWLASPPYLTALERATPHCLILDSFWW